MKIVLVCAAVLLTLAIMSRALGHMQESNPLLSAFRDDCAGIPQPCWYGIVPGVTTAEEIEARLVFAGEPNLNRTIFSQDYTLVFNLPPPSPYCRAAFDVVEGVVVRGEITVCREAAIRIGDLALLLENEPRVISLPPNEVIYGKVGINVDGWLNPHSRVSHIGLLPPNARFQQFPWRGFVSQRHYCDLVPEYPRCD